MTAEPVETLVERVREALESERDADVYIQAQAALTELAERLEAAERKRDTALEAMNRWNELWKEVSARAALRRDA